MLSSFSWRPGNHAARAVLLLYLWCYPHIKSIKIKPYFRSLQMGIAIHSILFAVSLFALWCSTSALCHKLNYPISDVIQVCYIVAWGIHPFSKSFLFLQARQKSQLLKKMGIGLFWLDGPLINRTLSVFVSFKWLYCAIALRTQCYYSHGLTWIFVYDMFYGVSCCMTI